MSARRSTCSSCSKAHTFRIRICLLLREPLGGSRCCRCCRLRWRQVLQLLADVSCCQVKLVLVLRLLPVIVIIAHHQAAVSAAARPEPVLLQLALCHNAMLLIHWVAVVGVCVAANSSSTSRSR